MAVVLVVVEAMKEQQSDIEELQQELKQQSASRKESSAKTNEAR